MTILLIITCLTVIGTCVWIVVSDLEKDMYISDTLINRIYTIADDVLNLSKRIKYIESNPTDIVKFPDNKSGGGGYAPRKHFNSQGYDTSEWSKAKLPTIKATKNKKLARKKKRK